MSKIEDFFRTLCRDFDFSHGGIDDKRAVIERLLRLADLTIVPIIDSGHSEHDQHVIARAQAAADAPYSQDTCRRYPWAAAARIKYLEGVVAAIAAKAA